MKYGTPTRAKWVYPYVREPLDKGLSQIAKRRLKWMLYIHRGNSVAKCARHFDVPVRTIWYWVRRFDINRPKTLENKSRKPHRIRFSLVPLHQRERVTQLRRKYPSWGRKKIQKLLKKEGIHIGYTRIQKIINQAGLRRIKRKRKTKRTTRKHIYSIPKEYLSITGGLVYFDVKHLNLTGTSKAYQFTAIDHATRYTFAKIYSNITSNSGKDFFKQVQKGLGSNKICFVGSDNGSEFLGTFENILSEQNVTHLFSSPRSPKQNPFVERVIKTIIDDLYMHKGLEIDIATQQEALDSYLFTYNNIRPHESLNMDTPYERYVKISNSRTM